ncbi:hypothetical protein F5X96DRAFT_615479 [Biscogniauxia mediterranea]|nr:hypothetical protein F5X96DRAFT_615479 [Biscogniauxia mediterranea]
MGIIRTTLLTGLLGAAGGVASVGAGAAYLAANTAVVNLTKDDPIFKSKTYKKYNPKDNPALQDECIKRVPLSKIRPELRDNEEALALEFCRGIWSRWGAIGSLSLSPFPLPFYFLFFILIFFFLFFPTHCRDAAQTANQTFCLPPFPALAGFWAQSKLQERYDKPPGTDDNLWHVKDLAVSKYDKGLRFSNHFEVVEHQGNQIVVRCGGSPLEPGLRNSDGLIFLSARVDKQAQQAEFSLKTTLFNSAAPHVEGADHPIPPKITFLHRWYVRMLVESAVRNVKA